VVGLIVNVVAVPPEVLVGLACWTYVSSAVVEVWLHVPFVNVWLQAKSLFVLRPRLAAYATPPNARDPTRAARTRRRVLVRRPRIRRYCVRERA
jgi:hypothetical protein